MTSLCWVVLMLGSPSGPATADKLVVRDEVGGTFSGVFNQWVIGNPAGHFLLGYNSYTPGGSAATVLRVDEMAEQVTTVHSFPGGRASDAAYDPSRDEYLVVSQRTHPINSLDPPLVAGRFLRANGEPYWIEITILEKPLLFHETVAPLQVAYNNITDDYVVSALVDVGGGLGELWVETVDAVSGFPSGSPRRIVGPISILRSQSLVFVPVADVHRPSGWYLLALNRGNEVFLYMLDHTGQIVPAVWDCNHVPPSPVRTAIPVDLGTVDDESYHAAAAYGVVDGKKRLMVVWEDLNNTWGGSPAAAIWGTYLDATRTRYCSQSPLFSARWIGATEWHNFRWWTPQVAYLAGQSDFLVVWRELSADNPVNDVRQEHIRAQWVEEPGPNFVLSRATGSYPGVERPMRPAVGVSSPDHWLATWDDDRSSTPSVERAIYAAFGWHPAVELFWDDFELGNLGRWSTTVP